MDINKGWLEVRQFERVKDTLKVVYYPLKKGADAASSEEYKNTTIDKIMTDITASSYTRSITEDISKGGLSIICSSPLEAGQLVIIDLFLPKISKPIKILTEVRNIERTGATYKAGLKTISISKSDLARIEDHIKLLKKTETGRNNG
ncbi:MAG TPA: PilZ domain-containing protein [Candidatus Goldiibacteriota bacterium]|nr:PilZ domain-containing protein [Candidatus Goldiibacteriota bacterium]